MTWLAAVTVAATANSTNTITHTLAQNGDTKQTKNMPEMRVCGKISVVRQLALGKHVVTRVLHKTKEEKSKPTSRQTPKRRFYV